MCVVPQPYLAPCVCSRACIWNLLFPAVLAHLHDRLACALVVVMQFMSHAHTNVELAPIGLTVISGPPGSGTSSILPALRMAFGFGNTVRSVRNGKARAVVRVFVRNFPPDKAFEFDEYGDFVIIERTLDARTNKRSCKLLSADGAVVTQSDEDLQRVLLHHHIAVNNPACALDEESWRAFRSYSRDERYSSEYDTPAHKRYRLYMDTATMSSNGLPGGTLHNELDLLKKERAELSHLESICGQLDQAGGELASLRSSMTPLDTRKGQFKQYKKLFLESRRSTARTMRKMFNRFCGRMGYGGDLIFNHRNQTLDVKRIWFGDATERLGLANSCSEVLAPSASLMTRVKIDDTSEYDTKGTHEEEDLAAAGLLDANAAVMATSFRVWDKIEEFMVRITSSACTALELGQFSNFWCDCTQPRAVANAIIHPLCRRSVKEQRIIISHSPKDTAADGSNLSQEPEGDRCFVLEYPAIFICPGLRDQTVFSCHVANAGGQLRFLDPEDPRDESFDHVPDAMDDVSHLGYGIQLPSILLQCEPDEDFGAQIQAGAIPYDAIDSVCCFKAPGETAFFVSVLLRAAKVMDDELADSDIRLDYSPVMGRRILVPLRADQEPRFTSMYASERIPCKFKLLRSEQGEFGFDVHTQLIAELLSGTPYGLKKADIEAAAAKVIRLPGPVLDD
eukprot:COSAG02_NODE_2038_length_10038_cov_3.193480_6_plen_679_part_00